MDRRSPEPGEGGGLSGLLRLGLSLAVACGGPACAAVRPPIVFLSDFGTADDSVALCKGVMWEVAPGLRVVDLTHDVRPYSIRDGARFLAGTAPYYPAGTVFVAVVDPGVGSARRPMVARTRRGQYFVLPDNGLVTLVADRDGMEAREITRREWMAGDALSSTFHGRDIFSPVAAHIARGEDWTRVGPPIAAPVRLTFETARVKAEGVGGEVVALDGPFGNLVTNIEATDFVRWGVALGETLTVRVAGRELRLPFVRTFSDVPVGEGLVYVDSRGRIALAINQGSFAQTYGVEPPVSIAFAR